MRYNKLNSFLKQKNLRGLLLVLFFISFPWQSSTSQSDGTTISDSVVVTNHFVTKSVSQPVEFRIPNESKIKNFKKQPDFEYIDEPPKVNWIQRLISDINHFWNKLLSGAESTGAFSYVVIAILAVLVILLILKFLKINPARLLGKKKMKPDEDINLESENVHDMNFTDLVSNAIGQKNYRLAIRYLFLRNLKKLSDKGYIVWQPNKTNTNYVQELKDDDLRKLFFKTSLIFDYVWYGELNLDTENFEVAKNELDNLEKLLEHE